MLIVVVLIVVVAGAACVVVAAAIDNCRLLVGWNCWQVIRDRQAKIIFIFMAAAAEKLVSTSLSTSRSSLSAWTCSSSASSWWSAVRGRAWISLPHSLCSLSVSITIDQPLASLGDLRVHFHNTAQRGMRRGKRRKKRWGDAEVWQTQFPESCGNYEPARAAPNTTRNERP